MLSTLLIVLPIFGLIFVGWFGGRKGLLGAHATSEINRLVVYFALPALLFDIMAHARWEEIWQPRFIAVFGLGTAVVFALTVLVRLRRPRHLADATIDGLNAGYSNAGFVGLPLVALVSGPGALPLALVATLITVCVLFGVAIAMVEVGLQQERKLGRVFCKVSRSLLRNPIIIAPIAGALVSVFGLAIPASLGTFLKMLGAAAVPCALIALGLFLAQESSAVEKDIKETLVLVSSKLLLQPFVTWILAYHVFHVAPPLANTAVLLAALPTGTGPFMLAEFYGREGAVTSKVVLLSTVLSIFTLSGYLGMVA